MSMWHGVIPAITTRFNHDGSVDHGFLAEHCRWMLDAGCVGIVPLGSLGEGATLSAAEKQAILQTCVKVAGKNPVIPGIAALSTAEACQLAQIAEAEGCSGLMVLPPYLYSTDWREMQAHMSAVISATELPVMIYNNPVAYRTDFVPSQIGELAERHPNVQAVKESSTDVRRVTAIRAELGQRLEILVGVDDAIVEGIAAGAVGWIAGLVNAFPNESVELFELAQAVSAGHGDRERLAAIYAWFLPLLRLDTVPKFVQLIKLTQAMVGMGSETVRAPRLELAGAEREAAVAVIEQALARRQELWP
ncbi:dihydrodipicolinate synthase family protein [Herpetosiphon sp. NSE202]|uniref:dihydrodipicolinate synthase family protein n=1 Tax=Herpetosiphon sp. NSE202 TaxID=3351349 RepID=UPI00364207F6